MSTLKDSITLLLTNRSYLYRLFNRIFGDEPNSELIEIAGNQHTKDSLQLLIQEDDHQFNAYFDLLTQLNRHMMNDPEETLDKLKSEYTYLLIGPNRLPAPPWESVYITKERTIFQESTLKVRSIYLGYNFLPAGYPHEADDHIALELDFMAHLAALAQDLYQKDKTEDVKRLLLEQLNFLDEHLLVWIGEFAEQIQQSKTHCFYPQMAKLTYTLLQIDKALLQEIIESI